MTLKDQTCSKTTSDSLNRLLALALEVVSEGEKVSALVLGDIPQCCGKYNYTNLLSHEGKQHVVS